MTGRLWDILEPLVVSEGLELVEIEFQREPRGWVLRLFVDREGGVTLSDCSGISREIGDLLDVKNLIEHPYHLEVSSPGLNRPLRKPGDFERFVGETIRLSYACGPGQKRKAKGVLRDAGHNAIRVDTGQAVLEVPLKSVLKARLVYSWADESGQGVKRECRST